MALTIADLFEHCVDVLPDRPALRVGDRTLGYAELEAEANRLAHYLQSEGIEAGQHVGILAKNSVDHVIAMLAIFKIRAVSINVNYRYVEKELDYIIDNSEMVALVAERSYVPLVNKCFPKHERLKLVVVSEDGADATFAAGDASISKGVSWAEAMSGQSEARDFDPRSGDDLFIVYTGGTTGFPKGVMWRQEDWWRVLGGGIDFITGDYLDEYDQSRVGAQGEPMVTLPISPIMHGGAQAGLLMHLFGGHLTILVPDFDPKEVWDIIDRDGVQVVFMTGDAMARPLIEEFESGNHHGSSLMAIASSAAIFSAPVKSRWLKAFPNAFFTDSIGSSECGFQGSGLQEESAISHEGPVISPGSGTVLLDEFDRVIDMNDVGAIGRTARSGHVPLGYFRDLEKSKKTFVEIDGTRYAIPGDFARVEADNKITLLGRGSNCINTGGEKVFPEEVENVLKGHRDVFDTLVIGIPDERYGSRVAAVVQPREGATVTLENLQEYLRSELSGYKVPRSLVVVEQIPRHVTGKANYPEARRIAAHELDLVEG